MTEALRPADLERFDNEQEVAPQQEADEPLEAVDPRTGETSAFLVWDAANIPVRHQVTKPTAIKVDTQTKSRG